MRQGIMLCYPFSEKRLRSWGPYCIVQRKYNGDRCRAIVNVSGTVLLSSEGHERVSVPHINEALKRLKLKNRVEFDGELYVHGMRHSEIRSIVSRTTNLHPDYKKMEYHIFDIINVKDNQLTRLKILSDIAKKFKGPIKLVKSYKIEEIEPYLKQFIEEGYEGIIIRHPNASYVCRRTTTIMKLKPRLKGTYKIVGHMEEVSIYGAPKGALGALICTTNKGDIFNVGTGFTRDDRDSLWKVRELLVGRQVNIKFQEITTKRQVPNFPVYVSIK